MLCHGPVTGGRCRPQSRRSSPRPWSLSALRRYGLVHPLSDSLRPAVVPDHFLVDHNVDLALGSSGHPSCAGACDCPQTLRTTILGTARRPPVGVNGSVSPSRTCLLQNLYDPGRTGSAPAGSAHRQGRRRTIGRERGDCAACRRKRAIGWHEVLRCPPDINGRELPSGSPTTTTLRRTTTPALPAEIDL